MSVARKRVARFTLLEQLQNNKVEQASQRYQACIKTSAEATEKLASLEAYFSTDDSDSQQSVYAINLVELNVFRSRLREAVAAQRTVCEQLAQQRELMRKLLVEAQEHRSGLRKVRSNAQRKLQAQMEKSQQRESEDVVTARYCRQQ